MPDLTTLPLWGNLLIFAASGVVVWMAGVRISRGADALARRTGAGDAVLGVVLLGVITSLPEVAVSVTAGLQGEGGLAVNNLLGGLSFQVAVLAIADAFLGRGALTSVNADPGVLLQGSLDVVMLTVVAVVIAVGDVALPFGVGVGSLALLPLYAGSVLLIGRFRRDRSWQASGQEGGTGAARRVEEGDRDGEAQGAGEDGRSVSAIGWWIALAAVVVLMAGAVATLSAEALATQTGMGTSFVGAVLLAGATSLPEMSTVIEAVRLGRYSMAFGDIFGTNLIDVALILLVDAVAAGPPVLSMQEPFSMVAALLGVLMTMIFLIGLVERRDRAVMRMGVDSLLVLAVYVGGLALLWRLR